MPQKVFYEEGLRFSCRRCSLCCRRDPGFVFLSEEDLGGLTAAMNMSRAAFTETFCRWVGGGGVEWLSLKEKADYDCIFWKEGCSVYEARPLQCGTFPFWPAILASKEAWESAAASCPGMGGGEFHERRCIEEALEREKGRRLITRGC